MFEPSTRRGRPLLLAPRVTRQPSTPFLLLFFFFLATSERIFEPWTLHPFPSDLGFDIISSRVETIGRY